MIFFQEYELVTFARKKGSKDKRPRKRKASSSNEVKPFARRTPGQRKLQDTLRPFRQKNESFSRLANQIDTMDATNKRIRKVGLGLVGTGVLAGAGYTAYKKYKNRKQNNKRGN